MREKEKRLRHIIDKSQGVLVKKNCPLSLPAFRDHKETIHGYCSPQKWKLLGLLTWKTWDRAVCPFRAILSSTSGSRKSRSLRPKMGCRWRHNYHR
jgi:hypothetical protein